MIDETNDELNSHLVVEHLQIQKNEAAAMKFAQLLKSGNIQARHINLFYSSRSEGNSPVPSTLSGGRIVFWCSTIQRLNLTT